LANGIVQCLQNSSVNDSVIQIAIGIDGLPLSKSSNSQLWPILAFIMNTDNSKQTVFPVGIYHGNSKPKDSDDFLYDFIMEATELSDNGIIINNLKMFVSVKVICCDVPARCFVLINIMETCVNGEKGTFILRKHFINKSPAYMKPMDSTILDIYLVDNYLSTNFQLWNVDKISKQIMVLPFKDKYVALPILHSEIYKTIL